MGRMEVIGASNREEWAAYLERASAHDIYHSAAFHQISQDNDEGEAFLFAYREGRYALMIPLLIRPFPQRGGADPRYDATSVYGYPGPLASHPELPLQVIKEFQRQLTEELAAREVVSVFSRLHPLLSQSSLLEGIGTWRPAGSTVSIDLTIPHEAQLAQYGKNHRRHIRHLRMRRAEVIHDRAGRYLDDFVAIYHENMARVRAPEYYFFDRHYFTRLFAELGNNMQLFLCRLDDVIVAGQLFTSCGPFLQSHLCGTTDEYAALSIQKLLIDEARIWGTDGGFRALHLGGGVGGKNDGVLAFKGGFSQLRHPFYVWEWVLDESTYRALTHERAQRHQSEGVSSEGAKYFPAYRR
jgi:hypothetical protein